MPLQSFTVAQIFWKEISLFPSNFRKLRHNDIIFWLSAIWDKNKYIILSQLTKIWGNETKKNPENSDLLKQKAHFQMHFPTQRNTIEISLEAYLSYYILRGLALDAKPFLLEKYSFDFPLK